MMRAETESPEQPNGQPKTYRAARRAFIAACEAAHVDTVARLYPAQAPDGKPLFMDVAPLGPRTAAKAVLVLGYDAQGTDMLIALLRDVTLPPDTRLVLVHALDPALFARVTEDSAWPPAMLAAVATEDLSKTLSLAVLPLGRSGEALKPVLQARLPKTHIVVLPSANDVEQARGAIADFFAPD
jgi:hypothetical protein